MIAIIDYGAGNLSSVLKAFDFIDVEAVVTSDINVIEKADKIVIPGVGAFADAMEKLIDLNLIEALSKQAKVKKILGICLGMQILFSKGFEQKECDGLSLIEGEVVKIKESNLKIPHIGWNDVVVSNPSPLLNGINSGDYFYFVHSYIAKTNDKYINAYCEYGEKIPAVVSCGNVYGAQFHPEKSSKTGLLLLKNFSNL
ncbi:MAG: imidazole glycerol phosphate synthase subunit HisH [Clostridia bacterium]